MTDPLILQQSRDIFFIDGVEKEKSFVIKIVSYHLRTASMVTQANNPGINVHQGQAKI